MKKRGHVGFCVFLIAISGYVVYSASYWSFKAGFFPLATAIPLMILALLHLALVLFGAPETVGGPAVETEFSNEITPAVARRRAVAIFSWIAGFILLVYLLGFPFAVPLFLFFYLKLQSRESWLWSTALTATAWAFFYMLFQRFVQLQFETGAVQHWLGL
jgi:Tripartite tricarboxylate transporter TctB family